MNKQNFKIHSQYSIQFLNMNTQRKRIFISGVNSELGYELVQTFRQDHLDLHNFSLIFGSHQDQSDPNLIHTSLIKTYHPQKELATILKIVMQCDLIILDLIDPTPDVQFILKTLHYQQKYQPISKKQKVIGVSNFQTWIHTRPNIPNQTNITKENYLLAVASGVIEPFTDRQYLRRIPHPLFVYNYELQNSILQFNTYKSNVQACVIAGGIFYGKSSTYMSTILANMGSSYNLKCYGGGKNFIPFTRLEQMCECVQKIASKKAQNKQYFIVVDNAKVQQIELLEILRQLTGLKNEITHEQLKFLQRNQLLFGSTICLQSSSDFQNKTNTNILLSLQEVISEFYESTQFKPYKVMFVLDEKCQNKQKIAEFLQQHFSVITEQQIRQHAIQLFTQAQSSQLLQQTNMNLTKTINKKNSKQQLGIAEKLKLTQYETTSLQSIIQKKIIQNYLLLVSHNFYERVIIPNQAIKNVFELIPYEIDGQIFTESQQFLNKFHIITKKPVQQAQNQQQNDIIESKELSKTQNQQKQKIGHISNEQSRPILDEITMTQRNSTLSKRNSNVSIGEYIPKMSLQQSQKRQQHFLKQYLFDNVVIHVSEALYQLRTNNQTLNLTNFIEKLKKIDERQARILSNR